MGSKLGKDALYREPTAHTLDGCLGPTLFASLPAEATDEAACFACIGQGGVQGLKHFGSGAVLGLRQGATENAAVCVALLEDLVGRGLDAGRPTLFVLDGSKALHAAVTRVWGKNAVIQRCQVHKKRNVKAHVPEKHHPELERRLSEAYHEAGYETAKASLEATARWLDRLNPDAASSLREGLEETLTVVRLGVPGALRRTLATTNPIESR